MSTEIRISTGSGEYNGSHDDMQLISEILQYFIMSHERAFICNVSGTGQLIMVIHRPHRVLRNR